MAQIAKETQAVAMQAKSCGTTEEYAMVLKKELT